MIFAFLKLSGKIFELMLKLNIFVRGAAIIGELIFKKVALSPSSPVALEGFSEAKCFCTNSKAIGVFQILCLQLISTD